MNLLSQADAVWNGVDSRPERGGLHL